MKPCLPLTRQSRSSLEVAGVQAFAELPCRQDEYAVLGLAALRFQADDDSMPCGGMVLKNVSKTSQMIGRDLRRSLGFNREVEIIDHEVDLDAAGQSPVTQPREPLLVSIACSQLVEDPVFESLAVKLRATLQSVPAPPKMIHHADIGKVKFRCGDDPALRTFGISRQPSAE